MGDKGLEVWRRDALKGCELTAAEQNEATKERKYWRGAPMMILIWFVCRAFAFSFFPARRGSDLVQRLQCIAKKL